MRVILYTSLSLFVAICGCEVRTNSFVRMMGNVEGTMNGKMQTSMAPAVDAGPVIEVAIPPHSGADCKTIACKVAVIDIDGIISNVNHTGPSSMGENPLALFKEKLDAAAADPAVKAVVLRINTPGGGVAASDQMRHELQQFRAACHKPVVASLLDLGCGGGYALAAGCDAIVAVPSGVIGGLGVLLNLYQATENMNQTGIVDRSILSGEQSNMGSPVRRILPDEKAKFAAMAKSYHEQLKDVVIQGRSQKKISRDADFFDGRPMTSTQALEVGLVDTLGYVDDAVHMAADLAKTKGAVAVMYRRYGDAARSLYAQTPNRPIQPSTFPFSMPGVERSKLPMFLYMWQAEPTFVRMTGF